MRILWSPDWEHWICGLRNPVDQSIIHMVGSVVWIDPIQPKSVTGILYTTTPSKAINPLKTTKDK
jgi:hypothetical protein